MQKIQTVVTVKCMDQSLQLINAPRIASGGVNDVRAEFEFCPLWDGLVKAAVFYTDPKNAYKQILEDDACDVPPEVLAVPGLMYMGVFGVNADGSIVRTSVTLVLTIEEGAITEATAVSDPTPELYEQVLAEVQKAREAAEKANPVDVDLTGAPVAYVTVEEDDDGDIVVGNAVSYDVQYPTTDERKQALKNIGAVGYEAQELTTEQRNRALSNLAAVGYVTQNADPGMRKIARENIDAVSASEAKQAVEEEYFTDEVELVPAVTVVCDQYGPAEAGSGSAYYYCDTKIDTGIFNDYHHEKVIVNMDGEDVECSVSYSSQGYPSIGNLGLIDNEQPNTGEKFLISFGRWNHIVYHRNYGKHTFSISMVANLLKSKYLPKTHSVSYDEQYLTEEQKAQARENIGAAAVGEGGGSVGDITWDDIGTTYGDTAIFEGDPQKSTSILGAAFKISDAVPTYDELLKGYAFRLFGEWNEIPSEEIQQDLVIVDGIIVSSYFLVCPPEVVGVPIETWGGAAVTEQGTYIMYDELEFPVDAFRVNGYTGFASYAKIDKKYLPLDEIGGVANWDAAEGEPGYIINKPFGDTRELIFPEFEFPQADGSIPIPAQKVPVPGNVYTVVWNGVEYNCEAVVGGDNFIFFQYEGGIENEPFEIVCIQGTIAALAKDGSTTVTLEIYRDYVKKLDSEFLPESGVTAGKYGSYGSGGYYFPLVTVDAYGRITAASEVVIPNVNTGMGDYGLMPYEMYSHIANGSHVTHALGDISVGGEATVILGNCASVLSIYVPGAGYTAFPKVYGAYVYTYTDASKSNRYWIPVDPKYVKYLCSGESMSATSITATAVVSLPEEYREYYAEGDSVRVLVIYEKVYGSSSSVM